MFSFIKKHYHWVIALIMLLQLAVIGGAANNYSGLFILPVTSQLQISRSAFSLACTLKYLCSFAFTLISGPIFLRLGNKRVIITGLFFTAIGYVILPLSTNTIMLAIGNIILGIGESMCSVAAVSRIINMWFYRYRGLVWGVVSASTGIGGSLVCILLSKVITVSSWRAAYFVCAGMVIIIFLLVLLLGKSRPDDIGLTAYGIGNIPEVKKNGSSSSHWAGYSMNELKRKPAFYMALASVLLSCFAIYIPYDLIVPHIQDQGFSQEQAIAYQSTMLLYLSVSKLAAGFLCDWAGSKSVTIGCTICATISLLLFAQIRSTASVSVAIVFYALALPIPSVLIPLLTAKLFGYRAQGIYHGIFMAMPLLSQLTASPTANAVFDYVKSYNPILLISAGLCVFSTLLYLITYLLSARDQKRARKSENAI